MNGSAYFIAFILIISFCLAECQSGQIDINSASLEELDKLVGVGPVYAQGIIDGRNYYSVDELQKVKGIGPKTLEKIKDQGLACIGSEEIIKEEILEEEVAQPEKISESITVRVIEETLPEQVLPLEYEPTESIINLNSDIKSTKGKVVYESRSEQIRKYSIYVFIIFLLIVAVFLLFDKHERTKNYSNDDY